MQTWFGFIVSTTVIAGFYVLLTFMAKKLLESLAIVESIVINAGIIATGKFYKLKYKINWI
jgi:hypothetical protein